MMKYYDCAVTFAEFPDETSLCVNITNCPGTCDSCSEPHLRQDIGNELNEAAVDILISQNPHITLFGFMGGDRYHLEIIELAKYIKKAYPKIKVGMYSGCDFINLKLAEVLDCYKIGRFILPKGSVETWSKQSCGPLVFPFSNQRYFEKNGDKLVDCTYKFHKQQLNKLERYILK